MPDPITGGILAVSSIAGGAIQAGSAKSAARTAAQGTEMSVAEQRAAREEMRKLLQPYVDVGEPALAGLLDIAGLNAPGDQAAAVQAQERSPFFQSLVSQGEDAILQNASATGGVRGGNVQGALAQFRPEMLRQFIEAQYGKLGGLAQLGQNSAAGVGSAGINSANSISQLIQQGASTQAQAKIAQGNAWSGAIEGPASLFAGYKMGLFK